MYAIPIYRFPCYIIGIYLGYVLRNQTVTPTPTTLKLGWVLSTLGLAIASAIAVKNNSQSDPMLMALFAAVAPLTLCVFFAWIIFVSHCGLKSEYPVTLCVFSSQNHALFTGALTSFFEWKYFKVTTSLSYGLYLVQFVVFNYNAGIARTPIFYSYFNNMVRRFLTHFCKRIDNVALSSSYGLY
jgi:peptidoglycan/LPS O-acetylase OafA/YrhL